MKRGRFTLIFGLIMVLSSFLVLGCADEDADGYGLDGAADCASPGVDCNDNNYAVYPGATETINGIDDDCNGLVDDGVVLSCTDSDNDGYNASASDPVFCPAGDCCSAPADVDCDDSSFLVNPSIAEICGDSKDNDCQASTSDTCPAGEQAGGSSGGSCEVLDAYWSDCDGNAITSANEGDSVYLVVSTGNCDEGSEVDYVIEESGNEIETVTEEFFANIESNINAWASGWIAGWLSSSSGNPQYSFTAKVRTPDEGTFDMAAEDELAVSQCPSDDPECGEECSLGTDTGFVSIGGRSSRGGSTTTEPGQVCAPMWDCTNAVWGECDTATGKQSRDTSLCVYVGRGDVICEEESRATIQSEKICASAQLQQTSSDYSSRPTGRRETLPEPECGNAVCEAGEDEVCPEDCPGAVPAGSLWWLWLLVILLLAGLAVGGFLYYRKLSAKPSAASGKSAFDSENDLKAVSGYIKTSRSKSVSDAQIRSLLMKSGWSGAQVDYAFKSVDKPSDAKNGSKASKPAEAKK